MKNLYFDHNATTAVDERVVAEMIPFLSTYYGNPSSLYRAGRVVRSAIDSARERIATFIDAEPSRIIFTSGGTEANNLALNAAKENTRIAISAVEHPSILEAVQNNSRLGQCDFIPVDKNGRVTDSTIEKIASQADLPSFVSIMLANNENGAIQNVAYFSELLKSKSVIMHTDAVQAVGKIPVSFRQLNVDLMTISSHKIYGPKGCGALVINNSTDIKPLLFGGSQEYGFRAGTENVANIIGFGKAAELAKIEWEQTASHCLKLKQLLERRLKTISRVVIFSEQAERLPNTVQFGVQGVDGEMLLMQLDQNNIAVSSGSACASGGGKASYVLTAMGINSSLAKSAIRVSFGTSNSEQEVEQFITILKTLIKK